MTHTERETGTAHALMDRLIRQRMPRLLDIKKHVEQGECLNETDIEFLTQMLEDANANKHYVDSFPEYGDLIDNLVRIYHETMERALENEKTRTDK